jgi:hypothetical protein
VDILGLEPVCYGGVLLSTPLHAILDLHHLLNVTEQLANKMRFYTPKKLFLLLLQCIVYLLYFQMEH